MPVGGFVHVMVMEEGCWSRRYLGELEKGGWGIGDGGGRWYEGGCWSRIKDKLSRMERVQHNTTIGNNIIIDDSIEDF